MTEPYVTPALIDKLLAEGIGPTLSTPEMRATLSQQLAEWGCPRPLDKLIVRSLLVVLDRGLVASRAKGRDILLATAMRWPLFRRLLAHVGSLSAKHSDRAALAVAMRAALEGSTEPINVEVDPLSDLDVLAALRSEQNADRLHAAFGEAAESIKRLLETMPSALGAPVLYDPRRFFDAAMLRASPIHRLHFGAQVDAFEARDDDLHFLRAFLDGPPAPGVDTTRHAFRWQLVYGDGGLGKSRLALELLRDRAGIWGGGFIDLEASAQGKLALWRPTAPTLLIVDYASRSPTAVSVLLRALGAGASEFDWPVRVLLLDRDGAEGGWLREVTGAVGAGGLGGAMFSEPYRPKMSPFRVGDTLREIALPFTSAANLVRGRLPPNLRDNEDAGALMQMLFELDSLCRPLFAAILGEQLAAGASRTQLERVSVVRELLDREERRFWLPDHTPQSDEAHCRHLNLLVLSTLARRGTLADIPARCATLVPAFGRPGPTGFDRNRFQRMSGKRIERDSDPLAPLEPDLLGELFVLDRLAALGSEGWALIDAAALVDEQAVAEFLARSAFDYLDQILALDLGALLDRNVRETARAVATALRSLMLSLGQADRLDEALQLMATLEAAASAAPELTVSSAVARANLVLWLTIKGRRERDGLLDRAEQGLQSRDEAERLWSHRAFVNATYGARFARSAVAAEAAMLTASRLLASMEGNAADLQGEAARCWENAVVALADAGDLKGARSEVSSRREALATQLPQVQQAWLPSLASAYFDLHSIAIKEDANDAPALLAELEALVRSSASPEVRADLLKALFNLFDAAVDRGDMDEAKEARARLEEVLEEGEPFDGDLSRKVDVVAANLTYPDEASGQAAALRALDAHCLLLQKELSCGELGRLEYRVEEMQRLVHEHRVRHEAWNRLQYQLKRDGLLS